MGPKKFCESAGPRQEDDGENIANSVFTSKLILDAAGVQGTGKQGHHWGGRAIVPEELALRRGMRTYESQIDH